MLSFLLFSLALTAPISGPDLKQIGLAHTNPAEFAKVHSPAGLIDGPLFLASHSPVAPNPPNSLAAQQAGGVQKRDISESDLSKLSPAQQMSYNMLKERAAAEPNVPEFQAALAQWEQILNA